ncbi:hypothetical protein MBLNU459_g4034t1 [Dothideomycetes sp. NU459]
MVATQASHLVLMEKPDPTETNNAGLEDRSGIVGAALAKKAPPPETQHEVQTRRWIIFCFWAVAAFLGLPVWYATTTVPRASLPLDSMNRWADGQACKLDFPVHVAIDAPELSRRMASDLSRIVQKEFDQQIGSSVHRLRVVVNAHSGNASDSAVHLVDPFSDSLVDQDIAVTVRLTSHDSETITSKLRPFSPVIDLRHKSLQSLDDSETDEAARLAHDISNELRKLFVEERETLNRLASASPVHGRDTASSADDEYSRRSNRAFKYAATYHLTFSLFSGSATPSAWDIKTALDEYLSPFLESFSSISAFTVDTQVQIYASLSPSLHGPQYDEQSKQWTLLRSDLSSFINAAEWPLSPSIGVGPTINFVLYVPSETQSPLLIRETGGTSWLIPQWGGVQILNPTPTFDSTQGNSSKLSREDLEPIMRTFTDQLDSLLGLPRSPPSLPLRLSSLTRERAASLILSASSTLGALSRLSLKLQSIAIPNNVAESVEKTIHHLEAACNGLQAGKFDSALRNARIAELEAEQAFFEPSMVGQVYFPDEHKVAVYVPLLGPMAVPVLMAALKEIKKWRQSKS